MGAYIGADLLMLPMIAEAHGFPASEFRILLDKVLLINNINRRIWQEEQERQHTAAEAKRKFEETHRRPRK